MKLQVCTKNFQEKVALVNFQAFGVTLKFAGLNLSIDFLSAHAYGPIPHALTHGLQCRPQPAIMSIGLCFSSDVITFDQTWHHLYSGSAGGKSLSNDILRSEI